jgi:hypothetical protein
MSKVRVAGHHRKGGHVVGYKIRRRYVKPLYRSPTHVHGHLRKK